MSTEKSDDRLLANVDDLDIETTVEIEMTPIEENQEEVPFLELQLKITRWEVFRRYALATSVVAFIVGGSFLGSEMQINHEYKKPYWLTYSNSTFISVLLLFVLPKWKELPANPGPKKLFLTAFPFSFLWFGANYTYSLAFGYTSVASILSIEQLATVLVFILSIFLLKDKFNFFKALFLSICIAGVIMIAVSDKQGHNGLIGDGLMIISTINTALYMVLFKKQFQNHLSPIQVGAFLGFIGIWIFLVYWPGIFIVHFTGFEKFELPEGWIVLMLFLSSLVSSLLFNLLLNWGIASVNPVFMRIVVATSIPAGAIVNYFIYGTYLSPLWISGASLIFVGFLLYAVTEEIYRRRDSKSSMSVQITGST